MMINFYMGVKGKYILKIGAGRQDEEKNDQI